MSSGGFFLPDERGVKAAKAWSKPLAEINSEAIPVLLPCLQGVHRDNFTFIN
jgi:hypothetical protein